MAKSPAVALLIGAMNKGKGGKALPPESEDSEKSDDDAGEMAAAEELLESIKREDAEAVKAALKSFFSICSSKEEY